MGYLHYIYHINWCRFSFINSIYLQWVRGPISGCQRPFFFRFQERTNSFISRNQNGRFTRDTNSARKNVSTFQSIAELLWLVINTSTNMYYINYFGVICSAIVPGILLRTFFGGTPARVYLGNHQPSPPENYTIKPSKLCGETRS